MQFFLTYAACFVLFIAVDCIWLIGARDFFNSEVGTLLRAEPNLGAAAGFYLIYIFGLLMLVVFPAVADRSMLSAAAKGALLGLAAYAAFDLSNLAILKGWTVKVALADMAWGAFATTLAAIGGYLVASRLA